MDFKTSRVITSFLANTEELLEEYSILKFIVHIMTLVNNLVPSEPVSRFFGSLLIGRFKYETGHDPYSKYVLRCWWTTNSEYMYIYIYIYSFNHIDMLGVLFQGSINDLSKFRKQLKFTLL